MTIPENFPLVEQMGEQSEGFGIYDTVVCVDAEATDERLVLGQAYEVRDTRHSANGPSYGSLTGVPGVWHHTRFRPQTDTEARVTRADRVDVMASSFIDHPTLRASDIAAETMRQFSTGATRNLDTNKLDYEGFLSPLALKAFAEYMHSHRLQADGTMRASDNWQKGIPADVYVKSLFRHFFDLWSLHRGGSPVSPDGGHPIDRIEALCAMMFNVQGLLHEILKERDNNGR